jgi:hypothetical protein
MIQWDVRERANMPACAWTGRFYTDKPPGQAISLLNIPLMDEMALSGPLFYFYYPNQPE